MTNTAAMEKTLEKIRRLLALATSSNEHEAQAAAAKASELMMRHNLSLGDVPGEARDASYQNKRFAWRNASEGARWHQVMVWGVGQANGTRTLVIPGKSKWSGWWIVGREGDIELTKWQVDFLIDAANRLAKEGYKEAMARAETGYESRSQWCNSFRIAFTNTVVRRLKEQRKNIADESAQTTALVVVDDAAADAALERFHPTKGKARQTRTNYNSGLAAGARAGSQINLNGPLNRGSAVAQIGR